MWVYVEWGSTRWYLFGGEVSISWNPIPTAARGGRHGDVHREP